jgi:hypothetical protein
MKLQPASFYATAIAILIVLPCCRQALPGASPGIALSGPMFSTSDRGKRLVRGSILASVAIFALALQIGCKGALQSTPQPHSQPDNDCCLFRPSLSFSEVYHGTVEWPSDAWCRALCLYRASLRLLPFRACSSKSLGDFEISRRAEVVPGEPFAFILKREPIT